MILVEEEGLVLVPRARRLLLRRRLEEAVEVVAEEEARDHRGRQEEPVPVAVRVGECMDQDGI